MFNPQDHMLKLKGKDYLQVMWRLVWFREEHPDWCINTELINYDPETKHAIFKASIVDANGVQKSSGFGSESVKDFGDFLEKAETKAVGRALAMLGYGTQFAPELDEGERIVDSPVKFKPNVYGEEGKAQQEKDRLINAIYKTCDNVRACNAASIKRYGKDLDGLEVEQLQEVLKMLEAKNGAVGRDQSGAITT